MACVSVVRAGVGVGDRARMRRGMGGFIVAGFCDLEFRAIQPICGNSVEEK